MEPAASAEPDTTKARRSAVRRALPRWRSQLIDLSGGNRLLYYADRKVAVIDLLTASRGGRAELLAGKPVRAGRLWPEAVTLAAAVKSLKAIERPARISAEEFGVQTTFLASGFATWEVDGKKPANAPILLRAVNFRALPGSPDAFELQAAEGTQLNSVLLHSLYAEHGVDVDDVDLLERFGQDEAELFAQITKQVSTDIPSFEITSREVIANFTYVSQSMVEDLGDDELNFLTESDMVAALAGSADATQRIVGAGGDVAITLPDYCQPSDEHLILDADGSQSYVINAIVAGQHLVVQGPPGSGKTQTITNTIAELVSRGKTVLFVAQKRAAITAVLSRLEAAGLDGVLLDLFENASSRKRIVQELGRQLETSRTTARPNANALQKAYADARDKLVAHERAMHEIRSPWGMSLLGSKSLEDEEVYDGFYDWALYAKEEETSVRFDLQALSRWDLETHDNLRRVIRDLSERGGLDPDLANRPGWSATSISTTDILRSGEEAAAAVKDRLLPAALAAVQATAEQVGIPVPASPSLGWYDLVSGLVAGLRSAHQQGLAGIVSPAQLPDAVLSTWLHATGDKAYRKANPGDPGRFKRRKINKTIDAALPGLAGQQRHQTLLWIRQFRSSWASLTSSPMPQEFHQPWQEAENTVQALKASLEQLRPLTQNLDLQDLATLPTTLGALLNDRGRFALPIIHELVATLLDAGCGPVLDDLRTTPAGSDEWSAADRLTFAFVHTVIEHLDRSDPRLAGLSASDLNRATRDFQGADVELRQANASRVRRSVAEGLVSAIDAHPDQAERLRGQVKRKRGFLPIRKLMDDVAPEVILAAKPVWAASPDAVSQLLPARQLFDVVLFDEASQVLPAAALPSIARARQVVVAGDDFQLPPTTVFTRTAELEDDRRMDLDRFEDDDEVEASAPIPISEIPDTESILDAISVKLGSQRSRYLSWHYRSRDEKLIATSNEFMYRPAGRMMTTFPAADSDGAQGPERYFIKNIERVQGDERDTIILTVGYAKGTNGRLSYNWGPVQQDGGHRRVNVAITRARSQMTLVTSFGPGDVDPNYSQAPGFQLMRRFIEYAATGGESFGDEGSQNVPCNTFEADIQNRLEARGLGVCPQWGVGGYRIDFAIQHPDRPGQFVLAVEADGASYHSGTVARERDRLRQELLEARGWKFVRIWSTDYFFDPDSEIQRVVDAYDAIIAAEKPRRATKRTAASEPPTAEPTVQLPGWDETRSTRAAFPNVRKGLKIQDYTNQQLTLVALWVMSDDLPYSKVDVFEQCKHALGFARNGKIIVERLNAAVEAAFRVRSTSS